MGVLGASTQLGTTEQQSLMALEEPDAPYWQDYDGLQKTKHQLLARYLDAWFPILSASAAGRLLYVDCHAGRGRHETGDPGSPVLVIERLLRHRLRQQILRRCEVRFHLFEINAKNAARLDAEIRQIGELPPKINIEIHQRDYAEELGRALDSLAVSGNSIAPAFAF